MKLQLPKLSCKYGAPMGRPDSIVDPDAPVKFYLNKLRFVDSCYDQGGAYWGMGKPVYWAYGYIGNDMFEMFVRARNRADAKQQVKSKYPLARFFN